MEKLKSSFFKSKLSILFKVFGAIILSALVVIINPFNIPKIIERNKV